MGLVDAAVGTTVSAYLGFKLMNRALERVFFQASRTRKLDLAKELVVVSNGERLCLQVVYDASTGKFFSPIIHQDVDSNILENSFLLRSMVFHGSHINHLMLPRSIRAVFPAQDSFDNLTEKENELVNTCLSPLLTLSTKKSAKQITKSEQVFSRWSLSDNNDST